MWDYDILQRYPLQYLTPDNDSTLLYSFCCHCDVLLVLLSVMFCPLTLWNCQSNWLFSPPLCSPPCFFFLVYHLGLLLFRKTDKQSPWLCLNSKIGLGEGPVGSCKFWWVCFIIQVFGVYIQATKCELTEQVYIEWLVCFRYIITQT